MCFVYFLLADITLVLIDLSRVFNTSLEFMSRSSLPEPLNSRVIKLKNHVYHVKPLDISTSRR